MCCTAYAPTYVALRIGSVPPHPEAIMPVCVCQACVDRRIRHGAAVFRRNLTNRVCPGIQDATENGTAIQTPPRPATGHIYSPKRKEAEARTTHHTCSAELPPLESTGVYRPTDLLVYRLRLSRPYRPALALT